jgi:hypothetical protein
MILSKAVSTAVDGPVAGLLRPPPVWEPPAGGSEDLVTVLVGVGVGEGLEVALRPRVGLLDVLLFWATAKIALTTRIEAATRNLFMLSISSKESHRGREGVVCG